jgi:hypothetical protein
MRENDVAFAMKPTRETKAPCLGPLTLHVNSFLRLLEAIPEF